MSGVQAHTYIKIAGSQAHAAHAAHMIQDERAVSMKRMLGVRLCEQQRCAANATHETGERELSCT